jgi:hypothetical protein
MPQITSLLPFISGERCQNPVISGIINTLHHLTCALGLIKAFVASFYVVQV